MTAKILALKKIPSQQIKQVENAGNEEELKTKWLVPILQKQFHSTQEGVHYEKGVLKGRVDVRLMHDGRTRGVIELKSPSVALDVGSRDFDVFFRQAHKYAHAFYVWRKGVLFPIQGILTNGHVAWVFDGGLDFAKAKSSAKKINLNDASGYNEFYEIISSMKKAQPHKNLSRVIEKLSPHVASADSILSKELYQWYLELNKRIKNKEQSLDLTLQLYLIAICRDCGFVPTNKIAQFESQHDWSGIVGELKKLLSHDFITLPKTDQKYLWELYDRTRNVSVRLDTFPPDALGTVYEKLVREIKGKSDTKTSFYTPVELIDEIIGTLKITKDDRVLDPTAGSAAFLVACIQKLFSKETEFDVVKKYIEKNIVGIDIDKYACIVGKASILSAYATTLPYDPVDDLKVPKVNYYCHDFFDKKSETYGKFDVVLGNPPWGSIDSKKVLDNAKVKSSFQNYAVYKDKSDICIYVYERAFNLLSAKGRMGMVCKLQTTYGTQHEKFVEWWNDRVFKVIDYGDEKLFNNEAQTAVILASKKAQGRPQIVEKNKVTAINFKGKTIGDYFWCTQGWQSANDKAYEEYAQLYPDDKIVKNLLKNKSACFFNFKPSDVNRIAVVVGDDQAPQKFVNWVNSNHPELKKRKDCSQKYGWKRTFHKEKFNFDGTQTRLITPRVWSKDRIPCVVDKKGELASITSLTVLIPKPNTPKEIIKLVSAWISSTYFTAHARDRKRCKPMGNGGLALYPAYIEKCVIPEWKNKKQIVKEVERILKSKSQPTDTDLKKLDSLFLAALQGLKATGLSKTPASISKHQMVLDKAKKARESASKKKTTKKVKTA